MLFLLICIRAIIAKNEGLFFKVVSPFSLFIKQFRENNKEKQMSNFLFMQSIAYLFF